MSDRRVLYPKWEPQLFAAIDETDPVRLSKRIDEVREILAKRVDRIGGSRSHAAELAAIEEAMDVLEALRRRVNPPKAS